MVFLRRNTPSSTPPSSPTLSDFSRTSSSSSGASSSTSTSYFPSFFPQHGEWDFTSPTTAGGGTTLVAPSLFLTCSRCPTSPTDLLLHDAQSDQPMFVARGVYSDGYHPPEVESTRESTVLVQGVEFSWQSLPDGSAAWAPSPPFTSTFSPSRPSPAEYILFESPPKTPTGGARQRPSRLSPLAVVTEDSLRLRLGKEVEWKKFYRRAGWLGGGRLVEGSWKSGEKEEEGRRYKWKRGEGGLTLIDCKSKEAVAAVRLSPSSGEPTQIILFAYVLPSLHLVLCTLLHRLLADDFEEEGRETKQQQLDRTEWWEDEQRAW